MHSAWGGHGRSAPPHRPPGGGSAAEPPRLQPLRGVLLLSGLIPPGDPPGTPGASTNLGVGPGLPLDEVPVAEAAVVQPVEGAAGGPLPCGGRAGAGSQGTFRTRVELSPGHRPTGGGIRHQPTARGPRRGGSPTVCWVWGRRAPPPQHPPGTTHILRNPTRGALIQGEPTQWNSHPRAPPPRGTPPRGTPNNAPPGSAMPWAGCRGTQTGLGTGGLPRGGQWE